MGSVYRKTYVRPLPASAEIFMKDGKRFARWKRAKGRVQTAPLVGDGDGPPRVLAQSRVYTAKYRDGRGLLVCKSTGCRDLVAARAVLVELERRAELVQAGVITSDEDAVAEQGDIPFAQQIEDYVAFLKAKGRSKSHRRDVSRCLSEMRRACRFERLADLDRTTLERWLFGELEGGRSARSVNAFRAATVAFANWCVRTRKLVSNPLSGIPKCNQKVDRRRPRRALSEEELRRLIDAALRRPLLEKSRINRGKRKGELGAKLSDRHRAKLRRRGLEHALIYKTLALTGLRRGELASITVAQLELDGPNPHAVLEAPTRRTAKGHLFRSARISSPTCGHGLRSGSRSCRRTLIDSVVPSPNGFLPIRPSCGFPASS